LEHDWFLTDQEKQKLSGAVEENTSGGRSDANANLDIAAATATVTVPPIAVTAAAVAGTIARFLYTNYYSVIKIQRSQLR
jgi:hypothetical protein